MLHTINGDTVIHFEYASQLHSRATGTDTQRNAAVSRLGFISAEGALPIGSGEFVAGLRTPKSS